MTECCPSPDLVELLGIDWPIIQAPMAGVSTPGMAAAVSHAGALGSIGIGAMRPEAVGAVGEHGFGAQWAGQGAPLARPMPAGELVATLVAEARL